MIDATNRRFVAGWAPATMATIVVAIAAACWMIWATRTLITVRDRHVVSVSLSALVREFVAGEARVPRPGDAAAARTRAYLAAVDRAVTELGSDGTVVLVSEATLGHSVSDRTADVRRRVDALMGAGDARR